MLIGDELVDGRRVRTPSIPSRPTASSPTPTRPTAQHVARRGRAAPSEGQRAWSADRPPSAPPRSRRAADLLRARRLELAALAVREGGKPWAEADADVCEAIDFLEYYAAGALALDRAGRCCSCPASATPCATSPAASPASSRRGTSRWRSPPGWSRAALATGNAVVLKPAEQAPACAKAVVDALHAGGVPHDALSLLPGGDEAGKALVADPRIHTIVFTGSCAVGPADPRARRQGRPRPAPHQEGRRRDGRQELRHRRRRRRPRRRRPRAAVRASASPGRSARRPRACSCTSAVADALADRLAGAVRTLQVGPAEDFATDVPPVIDAAAQLRIGATSPTARRRVAAGRDAAATASTSRRRSSPACPTTTRCIPEEIFGPVLALQTVPDIDARAASSSRRRASR